MEKKEQKDTNIFIMHNVIRLDRKYS